MAKRGLAGEWVGEAARGAAGATRSSIPSLVQRERLFDCLEDGGNGSKGVWVSGPPGAGKTTLVATFLFNRPRDHVWQRLTPADADPAAFFAKVSASARARRDHSFPTFTPDAGLGLREFAHSAFDALFSGFSAPFVVVLDDWHEIAVESPVAHLLPLLLESLPDHGKFIGISRHAPPASIARSVFNGEIRLINGQQLLFDASEAQALARFIGSPLAPDEIDAARTQTRGWAAGLRLRLEHGAKHFDTIDGSASPDPLVFGYFAEEVFRHFASEEQLFLLRTAIAPWLTDDLASRLSGRVDAPSRLQALLHRNYFLSTRDLTKDCYEYHPLFRQFLLDSSRSYLDAREIEALRRQAAIACEDAGDLDSAVRVAFEGDLFGIVCELIGRNAPAMLGAGRHQTLAAWLEKLPGELVDSNPWLLYWRGESLALLSPQASLQWHQRAHTLFSSNADDSGMLLSWAGAVDAIFRDYGKLSRLDEWITRFDEELFPLYERAVPRVRGQVIGSLFPILSFRQPNHPRLPSLLAEVMEIIRHFENPPQCTHLLTYVHAHCLWTGELAKAGIAVDQLRMIHCQPFPSPIAEVGYHLCEATHALFLGNNDACLSAIADGLEVARTTGVHVWDSVLLGHGAAVAASQGNVAVEQDFLDRMRTSLSPERHHERSRFHLKQGWLAARRGSVDLACSETAEGISLERENALPFFQATGYLIAGMTYAVCNHLEQASSHVTKVTEAGRALGNPMLGWIGNLAMAYVKHRAGDEESALTHLRAGLPIGRDKGYRHFLFWPRDPMAVVCALALKHEIEPEYCAMLVAHHQFAAPKEAEYNDRWPWPVKICTMGTFSLAVHGKPIQAHGKAKRMPLRLLKFLVARGGNSVSSQDIIEHLWPDSEGDAGEQSLATTLNRLRQTIGELAIQRSDRRLTIDSRYCWVDAFALRRMLEMPPGQAPRDAFERIHTMAKGRFLADEDDAPWALRMRVRLHDLLVQRLLEMGHEAQARSDNNSAIASFGFGLEIDELVEEFYRRLMNCHISRGDYSQAMLVFQRCEQALQRSLEVGPSKATIALRDLALVQQKK